MEDKLLNSALQYATQYGWAVFPVSPKSKKPLTPHGCKDAKKDIGAIKAWWKRYPDASIGIATGSKSNLIVIDEDLDEDKGLNGFQEVCQWEKEHGSLPETVRVVTGRGGAHLYYKYKGNDIKNRAGLLDGVDVRGEGGYVIAPPSTHPNGTLYEWEDAPDEVPLAEVDDIVKELLKISENKKQFGHKFELPKTIDSGKRNTTLYKFACSMQAQGASDNAIIAAVKEENRTRCIEPLPEDEVLQIIESAISHVKGELKVISENGLEWREPKITYQLDKNGEETQKPAQTIANAEEAIMYDEELFGRIAFNELSYSPYVYGTTPWRQSRGWREWDNADDSNLRAYIEKKYGLKVKDKIMDALNNVVHRRRINPVKTMLEEAHERWDGNKYIDKLLPRYVGAEDNEYNAEVMKLFMLGAIKRIYEPGCKFDYMLILVGGQGGYKSSFLRFLAVGDEWFTDNFNTVDGDKAFEKLRGMWIIEMSELQATKRAKDVEGIKAFITSRVDTYRAPYDRRTEQRPRQCVLAGTSNPVDFLTDRTGNRRFLPITCDTKKARNPHLNVQDTMSDFLQAWGEAMDIYLREKNKLALILPKQFEQAALDAQIAYLEDDPNVGIIQEWLDTTSRDRVCALMLWKEALGQEFTMPKPKDVNNIHEIMKNSITGWEYVGKQSNRGYGIQRSYERVRQRRQ